MDDTKGKRGGLSRHRWRIAGWGVAAVLLLLPAVAMQFTTEVNWSGSDFAVFGGLLLTAGLGLELAVRLSPGLYYRSAAALALAATFLLVWINLAVGIVGPPDHPANLSFAGVLVVGFVGTLVTRCRSAAMARVLVTMALAQGVAAVIALVWSVRDSGSLHPEVLGLNGIFVVLWIVSALLFREDARTASGR